jgi:predicted RNase H-like nuclease (RuvC/YqgF family)
MFDFTDIVTYIIAPILTAIVGYMSGRRKFKAEAQGQELNNVQEAIRLYRMMIEDLEKQIIHQNDNIRQLEERIKSLELENIDLKKKLA